LFIDKVRDDVGLYLNPPERAVVLCVDEKSQIHALDRTAPILPMLPGTPQRATHDDKRSGTSRLHAALDVTTGKVIGELHTATGLTHHDTRADGGLWRAARDRPVAFGRIGVLTRNDHGVARTPSQHQARRRLPKTRPVTTLEPSTASRGAWR
jgi:hypothetical protein